MAKSRPPAAASDSNPATHYVDPIAAFICDANEAMRFAGDLPYRPYENATAALLKKLKGDDASVKPRAKLEAQLEIDGETQAKRVTLYKSADVALRALNQTGTGFIEAESRVNRVVGICNDFLKWGWRNLGQGPPPGGSNELDEPEVVWTAWQSKVFRERLDCFAVYRDACADLLRLWQSVRQEAPPTGKNEGEGGKRPKGIPKAEAEILVRNWLAKHAKENPASITREDVSTGTDVSTGGVSNTTAWQAFDEGRKAKAKPAERTVPLSERMLAAIPADCARPDDLAALIEEQEKEKAEELRRHKRRHGPS